jgi:hypothetical protein
MRDQINRCSQACGSDLISAREIKQGMPWLPYSAAVLWLDVFLLA